MISAKATESPRDVSSGSKIDEIVRELSQAKCTAQIADKRCEDLVRSAADKGQANIYSDDSRKLTLKEHQRDMAEEKATRAEEKVSIFVKFFNLKTLFHR